MRIVFVLLLAIVATPALAWKQSTAGDTGVCLAWGSRALGWSAASPLGGPVAEGVALQVIRRSFEVWESEGCTDLAFVEGPRVSRAVGFDADGPNTNVLLSRDRDCEDVVPDGDPCLSNRSCANKYDCWEFDPGVIAMTTVTSSNCSGRILDADIELDAANFRFTVDDGPRCDREGQTGCVDMDLQNTLVHEIGHLIGLDHSDDRNATMYRSASAGETNKRVLGQDDRAALCVVYPTGAGARSCGPAATPAQCEARRQRYRTTSGCNQAGGGGLLAGLGVALFLARRRAR